MADRLKEPGTVALSIVVLVFNEQESLTPLHSELTAVCNSMSRSYEILYVDDGSTDGSAAILDRCAEREPQVRVIHFRRNFGKASALSAAFERTRGEIVITLDADLQDDPAHIPELVQRIEQGADLVAGWKARRRDPLSKTIPSRVFNLMVRRITGVSLHDVNCGLKAYTRACINELQIYGGFYRFLPVLAAHRGFCVEELVVQHRPRRFGVSKYRASRYFQGLADLLTLVLMTRYRTSPLYLFGKPGVALGLAGFAILSYLTLLWCLGQAIGQRPLLSLGVLLFITGSLFLAIGLIGELIVHTTMINHDVYSIRSETDSHLRRPELAAMPQTHAAESPPQRVRTLPQ